MEMKPEVKKVNIVQILITFALLAILGSLLGLYIYYGMYQAGQVSEVVEVPVEQEMQDEASARDKIFEALNNQSTSTVNETDRQVIMDKLMQSPPEKDSQETMDARSKIMKGLEESSLKIVP